MQLNILSHVSWHMYAHTHLSIKPRTFKRLTHEHTCKRMHTCVPPIYLPTDRKADRLKDTSVERDQVLSFWYSLYLFVCLSLCVSNCLSVRLTRFNCMSVCSSVNPSVQYGCVCVNVTKYFRLTSFRLFFTLTAFSYDAFLQTARMYS